MSILNEKIQQQIQTQIKENSIILYMKGTPNFPQCGFSSTVIQILTSLGAKFNTVDVLKDQDIRIEGVRKILKSNIKSLDDYQLYSLKMDYHKNQIKQKSKNILSKLEKIKQYGKKNSY